ncbi:MAG: ATP-dependent DNA helicase, partial [Alphaproteobacteria bacterium]|nr:ATP-dependent DNA helicase [Alphaproteobacteria bacterium]
RRFLDPEQASDLGRLDPEAIERVRTEAWPEPTNEDELHDALVWLGFLTGDEAQMGPGWEAWLTALARDKRVARLKLKPGPVWITAERLPEFRKLWPDAALAPVIAAPDSRAQYDGSPEEALVEILRGRLEGLGPVTEARLGAPLGLDPMAVTGALLALEAEGFAMRGRFTPGAPEDEWCERRLLARIHLYTVKRLRAEIEPVAARDFLRFLLQWQRVAPDTRMQGPDAVEALVGQLEGFEAAAGAWETEILPARIQGYEPSWLDDHCLAGRVAWARLKPRNPKGNPKANGSERSAAPVRTTPITLLARRHLAHWSVLSPVTDGTQPSGKAQKVLDCIREQGASFFDELAEGSGLLRPQVEEALAELVALGLVVSDSFAGLRALLLPADKRRGRRPVFGMEDAGRWALARRPRPSPPLPQDGGTNGETAAIEHLARTLLRRYGVVFWRLIEREADWLPPWRELLRVYRRLEARGEIRGGRFVSGFAGEQYALPDAVGLLREVRRKPETGALLSLSGADPLNLAGILTPGPKLASLTGNRLLYRDGLPIAFLAGAAVTFLEELDQAAEWQARKALLRSAARGALVDLS